MKNKLIFCLLTTLLMWTVSIAEANTIVRRPIGRIYAQNTGRQTVLYELAWTSETKTVGATTETAIKSVYREPGSVAAPGKEVVIEEVLIVDGAFKRYRQQQFQIEKQAVIERQGEKLIFRYGSLADPTEKLSSDQEDWDDRFVVGPILMPMIQKNWATVIKGDELKIRFGVSDRKETVGFSITKIDDEPKNNQSPHPDSIALRMKPTSFIIASLVKPLKLYLTKDGQQLLEMHGRVIPKIKKGEKWVDLDAETVY